MQGLLRLVGKIDHERLSLGEGWSRTAILYGCDIKNRANGNYSCWAYHSLALRHCLALFHMHVMKIILLLDEVHCFLCSTECNGSGQCMLVYYLCSEGHVTMPRSPLYMFNYVCIERNVTVGTRSKQSCSYVVRIRQQQQLLLYCSCCCSESCFSTPL